MKSNESKSISSSLSSPNRAFSGRWFCGKYGTERLRELNEQLNTKQAELIGQQLYQPWMSCPELFGNSRIPQPSDTKVISAENLEVIRQALCNQQTGSFAHFGDHLNGLGLVKPEEYDIERYQAVYRTIWALLKETDESLFQRANFLISEILPLKELVNIRPTGSGLSLHQYRAGIFLTIPSIEQSTEELAINFVHEAGHQAMTVYQYCDALLESDYKTPVYSAIRKVNRPALMSFHALAALMYMLEFLTYRLERFPNDRSADYFARRKDEILKQIRDGSNALRELKFTELGRGILEECEDLIRFSERAG